MAVVLAYGIENANFTFTQAQPSHYSELNFAGIITCDSIQI